MPLEKKQSNMIREAVRNLEQKRREVDKKLVAEAKQRLEANWMTKGIN